jgi:hypothetical protein
LSLAQRTWEMTTWTREMPRETWVATKKKRYVVVGCETSKERGEEDEVRQHQSGKMERKCET